LKNGCLYSFILVSSLFFSGHAYADDPPGVIIFPTLTYIQKAGTLGGDEETFSLDVRAGYRIPSGFYFGMIYNNTSGASTTSVSGNALGNSLGYFSGMFSVIASYYLNAQMTEATSTAYVQRSQGTGLQLDIALTLPLTPDLFIGPVLTFKDMTYSKTTDINGFISNAGQSESFVYPYFGIYYLF
jgi:hypothetical protein